MGKEESATRSLSRESVRAGTEAAKKNPIEESATRGARERESVRAK
jgi:hypothetical protein